MAVSSSGGIFSGFSIEGTFKLVALGFLIFWVGSLAAKQLGLISSTVKVGGGITAFAIFLAIIAAFMFINRSIGFAFSFPTLIPLLIAAAIIVAALVYFPKLFPNLYSIGSIQLKTGLQSIIGGLG
ncbi:MAG: hypothetical protein HY376_02990 [Candidatus Blackburnbacteria bacterium]|nr:hypothetical protein [Candidatus Blackburnbacteria bacterium]